MRVSFVLGVGSGLSGVWGCWDEEEITSGVDCLLCLAAGIHF